MIINLEQWKSKVRYQAGLLSFTCGFAALLLVGTEFVTRPVINQRLADDQNALLAEVLGDKPLYNDVFAQGRQITFQGESYDIYPVEDAHGAITYWVIRGVVDGYSGEITYLVGVNLNGVITGVRIVSHSETPGLGDKIERAKTDWILSFNDHSLDNTPIWGVKKDGGTFDQFSGATITPRAVVRGVHQAMLAYAQSGD